MIPVLLPAQLPLLLSLAAHATGLPPAEELIPVGADCAATDAVDGDLRVTFDSVIGTCARRPDGPDCTMWVDRHLDARELVVRRQDCEAPMPGRFVRDGACGDRPRWRWRGRLDAGHAHVVGRDFTAGMRIVTVRGESSGACPAVQPPTDPVRTPVQVAGPTGPRWHTFPAEGYGVAVEGAVARLTWIPGPTLQHWMLGQPDVVFESEPLPADEARATLAATLRQPGGLAVRHRTAESREWYEGHRQRGVLRCWRRLEMDLEQRLRLDEAGERLGPPMTATVGLREPAPAERCAAE